MSAAGVEVLYDDRDESPGAKFATMDLIGLPEQVVVGPRGLAAGTVEMKNRRTGQRQDMSIESAFDRLVTCSPSPHPAAGKKRAKSAQP